MSNKSREQIIETLFTLMEKHTFKEITVSEICAWATIARRTFYNNFHSKEDVLSEACIDLIYESVLRPPFPSHLVDYDEAFWSEYFTHFFNVNQNHKRFFSILFTQNLYHLYVRKLMALSTESVMVNIISKSPHCPKEMSKYGVSAYISALVSMLERWSTTGYEETPEEMSRIFLNLIFARNEFDGSWGSNI